MSNRLSGLWPEESADDYVIVKDQRIAALEAELDALREDLKAAAEIVKRIDDAVMYQSSVCARSVGILCDEALSIPGVQAVLAHQQNG